MQGKINLSQLVMCTTMCEFFQKVDNQCLPSILILEISDLRAEVQILVRKTQEAMETDKHQESIRKEFKLKLNATIFEDEHECTVCIDGCKIYPKQ